MHIPDGFLSPPIFASGWLLSLGVLGLALRKTRQILQDKTIPLMGVMAAFIFAAQMLNFPVLGGTSGHLLGGVLAAAMLGPFAGCVVLSLVLIVQCLIFQDGGLTALGANIFNMAIVGSAFSYYFYVILKKIIPVKNPLPALFIASWFSVVAAAGCCAVELALSGASLLRIVLPAMLLVHIFIGIGEGIITVLALGFILRVRPDLIYKK